MCGKSSIARCTRIRACAVSGTSTLKVSRDHIVKRGEITQDSLYAPSINESFLTKEIISDVIMQFQFISLTITLNPSIDLQSILAACI